MQGFVDNNRIKPVVSFYGHRFLFCFFVYLFRYFSCNYGKFYYYLHIHSIFISIFIFFKWLSTRHWWTGVVSVIFRFCSRSAQNVIHFFELSYKDHEHFFIWCIIVIINSKLFFLALLIYSWSTFSHFHFLYFLLEKFHFIS